MSIEARYQNSRMAKIVPEPGELMTRDIDSLPHTLYQMADAYEEIGLRNLRPGVYVYGIVTETIIEATKRGEFEYNEKMQQNMLTFADQHTRAVYNFIHGRTDQLYEWEDMFLNERNRDEPEVISGRKFYVNHTGPDLVRTQRLTNTDPAIHEKDYFKVDSYLRAAGRIALDDVMEMRPALDKLYVPQIGLATTMNMIIKRRKRVWHGHKLAYYSSEQQRPAIEALVEEELRRGTIQENKLFDNRWVREALRRATRPSTSLDVKLRDKLFIAEGGIIPQDSSLPEQLLHPEKDKSHDEA